VCVCVCVCVYIYIYIYIYQVIHKSVKHFKNSQQIDYATDHGNSYADRETLQVFFYIFHRCSMCPSLVIRQTSMRYSISFHTRVGISRSTRATAAVILEISGEWRHKDSVLHKPPEKKSHGVKSGDRGGHHINASSSQFLRLVLDVPAEELCTDSLHPGISHTTS
jgi:hypothetical protein